jgi:hypothetical protein
MLAPHYRKDAKLGDVGRAAEDADDGFVLLGRESVLNGYFLGDGGGDRGDADAHDGLGRDYSILHGRLLDLLAQMLRRWSG